MFGDQRLMMSYVCLKIKIQDKMIQVKTVIF